MSPEQQRLFDMLGEVVEICERYGLVYYLAGGTALGAVRHGGFIPWDDDVDLMMPRPDWERFVEIARNGGLPKDRVLSCHELNIDYPHVFGRYTDTTSCAIHYNQMLGGTPEGFIIDIFVLDPVPDARQAFLEHKETLSLYNDLSNPYGYSYPMSSDMRTLNRYMKRIESEGRAAVLGELAQELARYEADGCDYLVMRWAAAPRLFPKEWFEPERYELFEGLRVRVPGKCNDYLAYHYGDDWMYLPSEGNRITHDSITFLDVDYQTVQDDYLPFIDVERTRRAILNRRRYHIRSTDDLRRAEDIRARICASFARKATLQRAGSCGIDFAEALSRVRYEELDGVFAEFYRWQTDPELEGREEYLHIYRYYHPIYIDIGDDLLCVALENLIHSNRIGKAARIVRVREMSGLPSSAPLEKVKRLLEDVRTPPSLWDAGCEADAVKASESLIEAYPQNFSNRVFYLESLYRAGDYARLEDVAGKGLAYFPDAGEFAKYALDPAYAKVGDADERRRVLDAYGDALLRTTHAGIAQDVRAKAESKLDDAPTGLQDLLSGDAGACKQAVPHPAPFYEAKAVGRKTMALLQELCDLCDSHGIEHYLGPMSCRLALVFGGNELGVPVLDVLVPAGQMADLAALLEGSIAQGVLQDRALDCWTTNGSHLSYDIDYVDTTTTYLQLSEGTNIAAHGLKVTVVPIRAKVRGREASRYKSAEDGWETNGYELTRGITPKRIAEAGVARMQMALGRKRRARKLFSDFSAFYGRDAAGDGSTVVIRLKGRSSVELPAAHFAESEALELGQRRYPAPGNVRAFLAEACGGNWEAQTRTMRPVERFSLLSADMPYGEVFEDLAREGCAPDALFSIMSKIRLSMIPLANDLRIRNRAMVVARRSEARKRIYDSLESQAGLISELRAKGDFEQLESVYSEYEAEALQYLKKGLGLCPSKEHLDTLCEILAHKGQASKAEELKRLAPPEHYTPLADSASHG